LSHVAHALISQSRISDV